jgi:hypothetical protein
MRTLRFIFLGALILGTLAATLPQAVSGRGPESLVRIEKGTAGLEDILKSESLTVVQELGSCYLGRLDREEILALRRRGIPVSILDRDPGSKTYLLVRPSSSRTPGELAGKGRVVVLEPSVLLFWTTGRANTSDLVPANLARKSLPAVSITPFLRSFRVGAAASRSEARDPVIAAMADSVSKENIRTLITALQSYQTRLTGTPGSEAAASFIEEYFRRLGLRASSRADSALGYATWVVGELTGRSYPDDEVIVCAHFDSMSPDPYNDAPGADDDASGVAAVMEAARVLSGHPTEFTIRFMAFSGEEQGLVGSGFYASNMPSSGRRIVGVINLDMIAFADRAPEDLDVIVNANSDWLGERFRLDAAAYGGPAVVKTVDASVIYSDHASFWDNGYPALLGIEDLPPLNPHYHTTGDTVDTLNLDLCALSTRAALATAARLGQLVKAGVPPPPSNLTGVGSFFSSFLGRRKNVYLSWPSVTGAAGYNVYRSETSHLNYEKVNSQPVTEARFSDRGVASGSSYYYVVTALDAAGLESSPSREIEIPPLPRKPER